MATPGRPGYLCTYLFKYTRPEEKYAEIDFVSLPLCQMIFSDRSEPSFDGLDVEKCVDDVVFSDVSAPTDCRS